MPGHDKTGPSGVGPLTGRRMGLCANNETTDAGNTPWGSLRFREGNFRGGGRGYGFGRREGFGRGLYGGRRQSFGRGIGFQRGLDDQPTSDDHSIEEEIGLIKDQLNTLGDQLAKIIKRDKAE